MSNFSLTHLAFAASVTLACNGFDESMIWDHLDSKPPPHEPPTGEPHWSYEGPDGPEFWGELGKDFALCGEGQFQSPVDFPASLAPEVLEVIEQDYAATPAVWEDNGHTIVVGFDGDASTPSGPNVLVLDGEPYELLQFHFHARSEHRVDGRSYPLEMHLVHRSEAGELAVVGVFIDEGDENAALREVFHEMRDESDGPRILNEPVDLPALIPASDDGWAYAGSLTTPPCSEGVRWNVYAEPLSASRKQIAAFKDLYKPSNRPVLTNADIQAQLD